jgi:endonuclease G, mitochondrial
MAAPPNQYAFDEEVAFAAASRWEARRAQHENVARAASEGRYSEIDTPDRLAKRANRLLGKLNQVAPQHAAAIAARLHASARLEREIVQADLGPGSVTDALLERVIGETRDFLFVEFLEQGVYACRSVARIVTRVGNGRVSYGTGFMVSPRLLMTNHHVLPSREAAARSVAEFDYQRDRFRRPLTAQLLALDPNAFFLNDRALDFALVAVAPRADGRRAEEFGWCPLVQEEGKILVGEAVYIVQHPKGELKQVVTRENRLVDLLDPFAHYVADTEPGSSGSPVFNDQWEVVALHHSAIPKRDPDGNLIASDGTVWRPGDDPTRLAWVANEGVRISRVMRFLSDASVGNHELPLLVELLEGKPPAAIPPAPAPRPSPDEEHRVSPQANVVDVPAPKPSQSLTIPLEITITLRGDKAVMSTASVAGSGSPASQLVEERVEPDPDDPDYRQRPGYDRNFLGFEVPFPRLTNVTRGAALALPGVRGEARYELKYHHYSVIFNRDRNLAFAAGVNYDPTAPHQHRREGSDKWFYDPRVEEELQAGEDLYAGNPLDRGHLVRRADAAWGRTEQEAKLANDDTFHFTNCSPQHEITNQGRAREAPPGLKLWGKLEDHIASQGKRNRRRLTIFNGPVFRHNDRRYRGVKIPKEFWKVVVFEDDHGDASATAFVLTQAELLPDLREAFSVGEYKAVQVRMRDLEPKVNLDFGRMRGWDVLERDGAEERFVATAPAIVLDSLEQIVL